MDIIITSLCPSNTTTNVQGLHFGVRMIGDGSYNKPEKLLSKCLVEGQDSLQGWNKVISHRMKINYVLLSDLKLL